MLLALLFNEFLKLLCVELKSGEQSVVAVLIAPQLDLFFVFGILEFLFAELSLLTSCTLLFLLLLQIERFGFAATLLLDFLCGRQS